MKINLNKSKDYVDGFRILFVVSILFSLPIFPLFSILYLKTIILLTNNVNFDVC